MSERYDVIVVGGGGAGMAAALTAEAEGARVLLLDAAGQLGGSTAQSGGVIWAAGTSVQRAGGISDNAEDAFRYYMILNQYRVEPELARVLCDGAADAVEWLLEQGVTFLPENLYQSGVDGISRGHRATEHGAEIGRVLDARVSNRRGIDVALKTRVCALLRDGNGGVRGIVADGAEVEAGAVVLATGGFGANPEMLARYYPEAAAHGDWVWYIGIDECRGDAIPLTESLGVDVGGYNRGLLLLTPGFAKQLEPYPPGWLVYVNREGRRFIAETTEYAVTSGVVKEQLAGECFAIFDEQARIELKAPPPTVKNPWGSTWDRDRIGELARAGRVVRADTLEELGAKAGIRPTTLAHTIARYNAMAASGADTQFGKPADYLRPVARGPFYAARLRPAIVCLTSCGPRIDATTRVLTREDAPVPGLYAAGEATGNVLGERYCGGGNSISNAIVFGRIAGAEAARRALGKPNG